MPMGLCGFLAALFVGTLVEYWGHRMMHGFLLRKRHARHHQDGHGQGWLGEFRDYFLGTLPILWLGFLVSGEFGIGFLIGGVLYAMFAAYCHELQHARPELCFWLPRPVHHLHHHHRMWKHNFGISFDLWDRVFGTYKRADWAPAPASARPPLGSYLKIKWF
jgi:sterol desaturase/sphingolipid hydroxylase (fatty acid hydroxylase superfamily)